MSNKINRLDIHRLNSVMERDGGTLVGTYSILNDKSDITFICKCGNQDTKKFRSFVYACGVKCKACTKISTMEKKKKTSLEHYGVEFPMKSKVVKDKLKDIFIEKYGVDNPTKSKEIRDKTKATNIEKYGAENPFKSEQIKEKIKLTNIEKYGAANPFQSDLIKDKIKETNIQKYGVPNVLQNKEVMAKLEKTSMERYGCRRPSQNKGISNKIKESHINKTEEERDIIRNKVITTCIEKYGVESINQLESIKEKKKETNLSKYGVENHMQSIEIMEKVQEKALKHKDYKMPSGEIRKVQGYEPFALNDLLKEYSEDQIITGRARIPRIQYTTNDKVRYYFPDIYIPSINKIIEVKSTWTYKCTTDNIKEKGEASKAAGYDYEIWVYDSKGRRISQDHITHS